MSCLCTAWTTKQSKSSNDAGPDLIVFGFGVAVASELRCLTEQTSTEPRPMSLSLVCHDLHLQTTGLCASAACL